MRNNQSLAALLTLSVLLLSAISLISIERWKALRTKAMGSSIFDRQNQLAELERIYAKSFAEGKKEKKEPSVLLSDLSKLTLASWQLGHYQQAELALNEAIALTKKSYSADDPQKAVYFATLASIYRDQGKFKEAQTLAKQVLSIDTKAFGGNSAYVARDLCNAGLCYFLEAKSQTDAQRKKDLLSTCHSYYEKSAAIRRNLSKSTSVGQDIQAPNMASLLKEEGLNEEGERLEKAIDANRKELKNYQAP